MTLYHVHWCPECQLVQQKLKDLGIPHESVLVPDSRPQRAQVYEVSGQYYVPVLQDGDLVLDETPEILAYLEATYSHRA